MKCNAEKTEKNHSKHLTSNKIRTSEKHINDNSNVKSNNKQNLLIVDKFKTKFISVQMHINRFNFESPA